MSEEVYDKNVSNNSMYIKVKYYLNLFMLLFLMYALRLNTIKLVFLKSTIKLIM
jgi:hypothetical protein